MSAVGLGCRRLRRSSTGLIPPVYRFRIDACCTRSLRGFAPWTCRIRTNRFTFASKTRRPEAALVVGRANVHFFRDCRKCGCIKSNSHTWSFGWIPIKFNNKIKYLKVPTYDAFLSNLATGGYLFLRTVSLYLVISFLLPLRSVKALTYRWSPLQSVILCTHGSTTNLEDVFLKIG